MSFVTKLFIVLSIFTSLVFVLVAGTMVAKQENYKQRLASERVELEKEKISRDLLADHLAALQEEKRRMIHKEREHLLQIQAHRLRAQSTAGLTGDLATQVDGQIKRFESVTEEFAAIIAAYRGTLDDLVARARTLANRKNEIMARKSELWLNVAEVTAEVGRMREDLNVLDYQLYHMNLVNQQKRQQISLYREILGAAQVDTWGPDRPFGEVMAIDERLGGVVIINVGRNEGVQLHQIFTVVRGEQFCARIEIVNVYDQRAAGLVIRETVTRDIRVGDTVKPPAVFGGR